MTQLAQALLGQPAPDFTLEAVQPGGARQPLTLSSFAAAGRTAVLVFYSLDFSPEDAARLLAYSRLAAEFDDAGADLLGLGRGSVYTHRAWSRELGLHFPLLADLKLEVAAQYGVAQLDQGYARPAVFTVGKDGRVSWLGLTDAEEAHLPSPAEVLARLPRSRAG